MALKSTQDNVVCPYLEFFSLKFVLFQGKLVIKLSSKSKFLAKSFSFVLITLENGSWIEIILSSMRANFSYSLIRR